MKIKVEQRHIDEGKPRTADCCMVALALNDSIAQCRATVSGFDAIIGRRCYDLPDHVIAAIDMFDDGQPVEPFEFEIELEDAE